MAGTIARSSLSQIKSLSDMLDNVNAALAALATGSIVGIVCQDTRGNLLTAMVPGLSALTATTLLTAQQTNLQSQLAALGVT